MHHTEILLLVQAICTVSISIRAEFQESKCSPKSFGYSSFVCVCNATYCDTIISNQPLSQGKYAVYVSTKTSKRLEKDTGTFVEEHGSNSPTNSNNEVLEIQRDDIYQEILGFGGAFTDAAGTNIASLTTKTQENLLESYFGSGGLEYTLGRVNMASCDFSTREYSYDDYDGDFNLTKFALASEDIKLKIPVIQAAQKMSGRQIKLFASPWSAPAWMKTNKQMTGKGTLIGSPGGKYYQAWANYFVRFLQEYEKHNITFWGLTAENEPTNGFINSSIQATGFTAELQRDFILKDLGPALHKNGYYNVKLMVLDDQRIWLPHWAKVVTGTPEVVQYISGIAVHWYLDLFVPPEQLDLTHNALPDKFILATEACEGSQPWQQEDHVVLGSWERFDSYAHSIIQDLQHWVVGWTDWNIALNMQGGPNWVQNFVDSPIIVNAEKDEFYKQPMYYALGHFSKFVLPGAKRIGVVSSGDTELTYVAFINPDKSVVAVVHNRLNKDVPFSVKDPLRGVINTTAPANSMMTFSWW